MSRHSSHPYLYLVRVAGEIATKARRTRRRFQGRLAENIREALRTSGVECDVSDCWSHLLVHTTQPAPPERVTAVFGVSSVSPIEARVAADLDEIVDVGERLFSERVRSRTFAVRCKRSGRHAFGSRDVQVRLGAALNAYGSVDLTKPEVTVFVELVDGEALLHSVRLKGVGGLPLGVQGRAVCLISGGFDSAVAAWHMLKRGIALDYVFCNLGGDAYERAVVSVAKVLCDEWSAGYRPKMHVIDFARPMAALKEAVTSRYWQVVLKRLMYRAAEMVANETGAQAIVTGESVGQVSSQTLGNLRAIEQSVSLPVLRPLVGLDKEEIINKAKSIGTAVLSARVREYCAIVPNKPVTNARPAAARDEENRVDLDVLREAVAARRTLDLSSLTDADLVAPYLFTEAVPEDAVVLDCRDSHHYAAWHHPGARRVSAEDLARDYRDLEKAATYVLYCSYGVQSAYLAELMQRDGYEAYSFKGGVKGLRSYMEGRDV